MLNALFQVSDLNKGTRPSKEKILAVIAVLGGGTGLVSVLTPLGIDISEDQALQFLSTLGVMGYVVYATLRDLIKRHRQSDEQKF